MKPASAPVLVLGNGVVGAEKQALALAAAVGLPYSFSRHLPCSQAMWLPLRLQLLLQRLGGGGAIGLPAPCAQPLLVLSCGRASVPACVAIREATGGSVLTVHIQRPQASPSVVDLIVAPQHDYAPDSAPANAQLTVGSLHAIDRQAESLPQRSRPATTHP